MVQIIYSFYAFNSLLIGQVPYFWNMLLQVLPYDVS